MDVANGNNYRQKVIIENYKRLSISYSIASRDARSHLNGRIKRVSVSEFRTCEGLCNHQKTFCHKTETENTSCIVDIGKSGKQGKIASGTYSEITNENTFSSPPAEKTTLYRGLFSPFEQFLPHHVQVIDKERTKHVTEVIQFVNLLHDHSGEYFLHQPLNIFHAKHVILKTRQIFKRSRE